MTEGRYSVWQKDYRLLISNDFYEKHEVEPEMSDGRVVPGIINIAPVKGYIAVAAKSEGTTELAMYITDDTQTWHRAEFGDHKLEEDAYTILESTNYSIQVDVMASKPTSAMGVLFTSNSNGTYFTKNIEHTNRNFQGFVDFEKIQNIQGIVMVNTVDNYKEVESSWLSERKLKTSISFDDGRTWESMKADGDPLHLHSVTAQRNFGRIFSSPAPGIVMGVGNTGKFLGSWEDGDTYVSDDAGVTWTRAVRKPHLYEIGDQGAVLVAVVDGETDEIKYSLNHGKDWESVDLDLKDKIRPLALLTVPDSTSLKFILIAQKIGDDQNSYSIISIDFSEMHERKCGSDDFEKWAARVDDDGKPSCIMGHKQFYMRRKAKADCFVDQEFKDPQPEFEDCKCTAADYECDYNFVRSEDGKECLPAGTLQAPEGVCKSPEDTFEGSSGFRLIPGNTCDRKSGVVLDEPVSRPCKDTYKAPANGKITHELTSFKADSAVEYYYLERKESASGDDETIIMRTNRRETYKTHDHGKTWEPAVDDEIVAIYPHQYFNDRVYMITASKKVYYSENRGKNIHSFEAPEEPNQDRLQILSFHPHNPDWLLWTGGKDCGGFGTDCHSVAHVSTKHGDEWTTLLRFVRKCQWVAQEGRAAKEELVYCEQYTDEDPTRPLQLISSDDWFEHKTNLFPDVINFATMSEFIIVALRDEETLRVDTSIDGAVFANAKFPKNFEVPHQRAYTVLDSSTHSIFLHVTVNNRPEQEYGAIVKSNSNGTSYVMSIEHVNRNTPGYVDFEKMQGLEGVAVVNIVSNAAEVDGGASKKLKTMITHNDGAEWSLITPPSKDSDGKSFNCDDSIIEKCSLHLHGYTERRDPRDTFSSPSAVGLMMGVGNVGPSLVPYKEGNTFITRDGGITWHEVFKGTYMWEYGDQGSIIVIVEEDTAVNVVYYTTDEGASWTAYQFADNKMVITDISTVPSDTSRNFLLWGKSDRGTLVTINLDFTGLTDRKCVLDEDAPEGDDSDYELWSPSHPLQDTNCLFGHVSQYHRKKVDSKCYNGASFEHLHSIGQNCTCSRQDFEWYVGLYFSFPAPTNLFHSDYNYERQTDGSCALVSGLQPLDPLEQCRADTNLDEYYEPTGYRRIPLTTCQGGKEMDYTSTSHPCPNHEEQYEKKHGISGVGLFFAITIPIIAAAGVGWWVWANWERQFGSIRLGDSGPSFDTESPWVRWPVAALSGLVAVVAAIPMVLGGLWRSVSSRFGRGAGGGYARPYTSRSSFQRGRGDYAVVDPDEGELLGDDSEEEV